MLHTTITTNPTELLEQHKELIQACITGDRNAQNILYKDFSKKMFGVCMRYSRSREEAEEIMQEGFVQVFKSLHNFKYAGSFEGWIRKIMVYCAIQHYRSSPKLYPVTNFENIKEEPVCREDIIGRLQKKELVKMIQKLPPSYRMVFNLYVFEGLKHREIAVQLGISEGTSKSNFFDAKQLLQRAIFNSLKVAKNY